MDELTHSQVDQDIDRPGSVLIVTSTFPSNQRDGRPAFVLDLARSLASHRSVAVLAPSIKGETPESWPDIDVHRFSYFPGRWQGLADDAILPTLRREPWRWIEVPFFILAMLWRTVRLCRQLRPQVVNAHWIIPGGLVAWLAGFLTGIPFVVTVHGADAHGLDTAVGRAIKRRILRRARRIVPVSETARTALLSLDRDLAHLLTEPVPMGVSAPTASSDQERLTGCFLFVGRLAEKKGLLTALEAIAKVEDAQLYVIGAGPEEKRIRMKIKQLGLENRVRLLGRLDRESVFEHLNSCTGVIVPSIVASDGDQDGTPVVLAEAAATGTPVIASAIAGLSENIRDGETGVLVPPGDVDALVERIRWVLADPTSFHGMGTSARETFADSVLDIAATGTRYATILDEAVSS
jgi:glycosyltransferase involved in cell wall biosynthesis